MQIAGRLGAGTLAAATIAALMVSCSSGSGTSPSGGTPSAVTITIAHDTVSPANVVVPQGSQVTFVNNDSGEHLMFSDPHPEHTDCPDINQVGFLSPGQSRQTGNLTASGRCGFHDHENPDIQSLHGSITIR